MRAIGLAWLLPLLGFLPMNLSAATTITLINEDFSTGAGVVNGTTWSNSGLNWVWSRITGTVLPSGTEVYGPSGSSARGMPSTHGGFEVFSQTTGSDPVSGSLWQVAVQVTLPVNYPAVWSGNTISFNMGYRSAVSASSFELYNITDGRSIVSQSITGSTGTWSPKAFNLTFLAADAGDVVELRWRDAAAPSSPRASGLEVGMVRFDVVPEPSVGSLLLVGMAVALRKKRRRSEQ